MPTDYEGNATATQAPGVQPEADAIVRLALPVDGEAMNVSSVWQALKVLADKCKWLQGRIAKAAITPRFLDRARTALGHTRWALDRMGLPAATILQWQEHWHTSNWMIAADTAGEAVDFSSHWSLVLQGLNSSAGVSGEDAEMPGLNIGPGDALDDHVEVWSGNIPDFSSGIDMAVETSMRLDLANHPDVSTVFGMSRMQPGTAFSSRGLLFVKTNIGPEWYCSAIDALGGQTLVPSGVVPSSSAYQRLRIEFRGASVNDGGAPAAYYFIDGGHVATITTNLPAPSSSKRKAVVFATKNITGNPPTFRRSLIRAVNFACNYLPAVIT
jgi:hypothetical protein